MSNIEQPTIILPPEKLKKEKETSEVLEEPVVSEEIKEIKIKKKASSKEKSPKEKKSFSRKTKTEELSPKTEAITEIQKEEIQPEETLFQEKESYSKEEWLEIVETLKEQAEIQREKEKIEEQEEIIELNQDMAVIEEPEETKKDKRIVDLYKKIRETRQELAESEEIWEKFKAKGMPDYEKFNRNQAVKEAYNNLQRELLECYLKKAENRWGRNSEKFVEFKNHLILKGFIGKERERFLRAKEEAFPPKEKSRFRNFLEKISQTYAKIPKTVRWGITAGLGTLVAFGTGGVAAPALLSYAGFRYGRAALGSFSAAGAKALGDAAEKLWLKKYGKEAQEEKIKSDIERETQRVNDLEILSHYLMAKNNERNEKLANLVKRQKQWRVGKIVAMIGAGAGISFWAGSIDNFTHETGVTRSIQEQLGIKGEKPIISSPEETPSIKVSPEIIKTEFPKQFIEIAKPGDSVWKLVEQHLEKQGYFKTLTGSAEEIAAKKTFLIDWVKDRIAENPEKFGLTDPDKIMVGQEIDFSKIFIEDEMTMKVNEEFLRALEKVQKLSPSQIKHINYNNELISQWLKTHPGERLTSDKVAEILGGKRLAILNQRISQPIEEIPGAEEVPQLEKIPQTEVTDWEDYYQKLSSEQKELELQSWEDYSNLPKLNKEEMLELQDYYGAQGEEAVKEFLENKLKTYNDILEILTPINMRPAEYLAIKNVTVGKFLEETAGGWDKWRSDEAITIDLPHDGVYGAAEYGRQLKLAQFIKSTNPTDFDKILTIEEYLKKFIKK